MTILTGEVYKCEGLSDMKTKLDVTGLEILQTASSDEKEKILERYNEHRNDWNSPVATSLEDLPEFVYDEWYEFYHEANEYETITEILRRRDKDYVHLSDPPFHTIVEVYDNE